MRVRILLELYKNHSKNFENSSEFETKEKTYPNLNVHNFKQKKLIENVDSCCFIISSNSMKFSLSIYIGAIFIYIFFCFYKYWINENKKFTQN